MAVSKKDLLRYKRLFPHSGLKCINNIKFDRIKTKHIQYKDNPLRAVIPEKYPFLVLGSVRKKEEDHVEKIIQYIRKNKKNVITGLFPRHLKRVIPWARRLDRLKIPWVLRSGLKSFPEKGSIIIWDVFGELNWAYGLAKAVFVGGSLAPLGGHNFLEPLTCGVIPVTGPFWDDFAWVGKDIKESKLALMEKDWKAVAKALIGKLDNQDNRKDVMKKAQSYFLKKQGGAQEVCNVVEKYLLSYKTG